MAISEGFLLKGMSGSLHKQLVVKQYGGKTVVGKYPDMSRRKLSVKQKRMNGLMAEANYAAQEILADEKQRNAAQARLNVTRNKLYTSLIGEYFRNALSANNSTASAKKKK